MEVSKNILQVGNIASFQPSHLRFRENGAYAGAEVGVSVIITLYNYAAFIERCVRSVEANDFEKMEIIIVDDASTDHSRQVAEGLLTGSKLPGLLIEKALNTGVAHSRNTGIAHARGEYVFTLDADNYLTETCIGKLFKKIKRARAMAAYSTIQQVDEDGHFRDKISYMKYSYKKLLNGWFYIDAMAMFHRQKLMEMGMYSTELLRHGIGWEDYELWLRIGIAKHKVVHVPEVLAYYSVRKKSMLSETMTYYDSLKNYLNTTYGSKIR